MQKKVLNVSSVRGPFSIKTSVFAAVMEVLFSCLLAGLCKYYWSFLHETTQKMAPGLPRKKNHISRSGYSHSLIVEPFLQNHTCRGGGMPSSSALGCV